MPNGMPERAWFGPLTPWADAVAVGDTREFARIWQGFMTARFTLGMVLVALQLTLYAMGIAHNRLLIFIGLAYFASTLTSGLFGKPRFLGRDYNQAWIRLVGIDLVTISCLQVLQQGNINYTPLFAMPILLASVLGSLQLALGTAAGVTLLLLGGTLWTSLADSADFVPHLVQAALSGVGYFVIALLGNQLSTRLALEGLRSRRSQAAANLQRLVNELVVASFPDGVVIVDASGSVRAANPAARQLLGYGKPIDAATFNLAQHAGWLPLLHLAHQTHRTGERQDQEVTIDASEPGARRVRVSTRLAVAPADGAEGLAVLFLQDQRELEARLRTEKLASMGRLSTAVAHEIRNPLAAISQANALLEEELTEPRHQQLTHMISQNAQRLARIVDDILNTLRTAPQGGTLTAVPLALGDSVEAICREWAAQNALGQELLITGSDLHIDIHFGQDHLRRVLVNLLDNARRYASLRPHSIQVRANAIDALWAGIAVWSDGAPLEPAVEAHLFEPFFSSESRSSGLGLYICKELCDGYGASLEFRRNARVCDGSPSPGNEFALTLQRPTVATPQPTPAEGPAP
jgi:two-component system sensor histidine kinase PilS (NtrC family)